MWNAQTHAAHILLIHHIIGGMDGEREEGEREGGGRERGRREVARGDGEREGGGEKEGMDHQVDFI